LVIVIVNFKFLKNVSKAHWRGLCRIIKVARNRCLVEACILETKEKTKQLVMERSPEEGWSINAPWLQLHFCPIHSLGMGHCKLWKISNSRP